MERHHRNHLIESLVILALIAVFGPKIYAPKSERYYIEPTPPPAFPIIQIPKAVTPLETLSPKVVHPNIVLKKPKAYLVSLGEFVVDSHSQKIITDLAQNQFHVFNKKNATGQTQAIYVGPVASQKDAQTLLARIEERLQLHGTVIQYHPVEF